LVHGSPAPRPFQDSAAQCREILRWYGESLHRCRHGGRGWRSPNRAEGRRALCSRFGLVRGLSTCRKPRVISAEMAYCVAQNQLGEGLILATESSGLEFKSRD
jgi:hypothetical protein